MRRWLAKIFVGLFVLSLACGVCYLWIMRSQLAPTYAWIFVVGIVSFIASFCGVGNSQFARPTI